MRRRIAYRGAGLPRAAPSTRRGRSRLLLALAPALVLSACELWGGYDNPGDPKAKGYQGFATVASPEQIRIASPALGDALSGAVLTVTGVTGAKRYGVRIWESGAAMEAAIAAAPSFEKLDFASNALDLSASGIEDGRTYYVKVGAEAGSGVWGWSAATAVRTKWTASVAPPAFSPAGGAFASNQNIVMATTTEGATIRYTTDGSAPDASSPAFVPGAPVFVGGDGTVLTIKAMAARTGMIPSATATATFSINWHRTATPRFDPPEGSFAADQAVSIACDDQGATIYYTMSATGTPPEPTTGSATFDPASPILVAGDGATMRVKALAVKGGKADSAISSAAYAISYPPAESPTFDPPAGAYSNARSVTINCGTAGATIYYTTDGSDPASSGTRRSSSSPAVSIDAAISPATTIRALAVAPNHAASAERSGLYYKLYNLGDMGPGGGLVFYSKGSYEDGWCYLEAASSDLNGRYAFGEYSTIATTSTAIGSGASNTALIIASLGAGSERFGYTYAAKACAELVLGGCSDWFLPSRDELIMIMTNLRDRGLVSFQGDIYWSSSEVDTTFAYMYYLAGSRADIICKWDMRYVRPVRAF